MCQGDNSGSTAAAGSTRRLVLTSAALLERRSDSYEVAERRQLAQIAALVRFIDQPQWIAIEWTDGARPTMYITPARDALLTALLDAAQVLSSKIEQCLAAPVINIIIVVIVIVIITVIGLLASLLLLASHANIATHKWFIAWLCRPLQQGLFLFCPTTQHLAMSSCPAKPRQGCPALCTGTQSWRS